MTEPTKTGLDASNMTRTIVFVLVAAAAALLSYAPGIETGSLEGEWVADSASYYLRFSNDSVSVANTSATWQRTGEDGGQVIRFVAKFLDAPQPLTPFVMHSDSVFILRPGRSRYYLGRFTRRGTQLVWSTKDGIFSLSKLSGDAAMNVEKVQISHSSQDRKNLIYDAELADTVLLFHGTERATRQGYFRASISPGTYRMIQEMVRKVRMGTENDRYRVVTRYYSDVPEYGVTVFFNGRSKSFLFNMLEVPPEMIGLMTTMDSLLRTSNFMPIDTVFWFQSRLTLTDDLNDSLNYLHNFEPERYRSATYPGGFQALNKHLMPFLVTLPDSLWPYDCDVFLDENGRIVDVKVDAKRAFYTLDALKTALKGSRDWTPAVWEGKRIPSRRWICLWSRGSGEIF